MSFVLSLIGVKPSADRLLLWSLLHARLPPLGPGHCDRRIGRLSTHSANRPGSELGGWGGVSVCVIGLSPCWRPGVGKSQLIGPCWQLAQLLVCPSSAILVLTEPLLSWSGAPPTSSPVSTLFLQFIRVLAGSCKHDSTEQHGKLAEVVPDPSWVSLNPDPDQDPEFFYRFLNIMR